MGTPVIRLDKIGFRYGYETVLENISVSIFKGDYIGLIGPNGKTGQSSDTCRKD
ncbi:MAG: hypothetical protein HY779_02835 [Rubrobacteridae bacterium]|nr:hypothetical protein [Rubrobacteridae bacterium]